MINLTIDGIAVSVPKGTTVYHASKQLGIELPIFCYQDRMPPFGACRVCLVEVEKTPKLQTSCTLEATEGMVVRTQSDPAVRGRKDILEFLLINHPLDCPICDKGGECPLQDQTLSDGPGRSRFFEVKRHFEKPLPLGPVLMLDRERCIACARCTRFGEHVAGDHALEFIDRGYKTEVGTPDGEPVESKFIGNTIKICPVGALTSQVYRFRARPWDNQTVPTTCTLCPVGCSMYLDSRDGEVMRTRSRENGKVNDIWMCDKGWFGYEFAASPARLTKPLIKKEGGFVEVSWDEAYQFIETKIASFKDSNKFAGWGGNPLTVEENHLFQKLFRKTFNSNHLDARLGEVDYKEVGISAGMKISGDEIEKLNFALICGLDLTEEFPVIWLRLKAAINKGAKVHFVGHFRPEIFQHLTSVTVHAPGDELEVLNSLTEFSGTGAIFVGRQYLNSVNRLPILSKLQEMASKSQASLNVLEGSGNSMGARFAGMLPLDQGKNGWEVLEEASSQGWDLIWVAGSDPINKFPTKLWQSARQNLKLLIVQDLFLTDTAKEADVILPTLSYIEKGGTFVNIEGRVERLLPGKMPLEGPKDDSEIFTYFNKNKDIDRDFETALSQEKLAPINVPPISTTSFKRLEGDLLATFAVSLFDEGVRMRHDPHVIQLIKPPRLRLNSKEAANRNLNSEDKVQLQGQGVEWTAYVTIDEGVADRTIVIPVGFDEIPAFEFTTKEGLLNGIQVALSKEPSYV